MKKLFFLLVFAVSLAIIGCPKGPSGDVQSETSDTTQVDSPRVDTVVVE